MFLEISEYWLVDEIDLSKLKKWFLSVFNESCCLLFEKKNNSKMFWNIILFMCFIVFINLEFYVNVNIVVFFVKWLVGFVIFIREVFIWILLIKIRRVVFFMYFD